MKKNKENVGYYNKFLLNFAISVNIINQIEKHFCFVKPFVIMMRITIKKTVQYAFCLLTVLPAMAGNPKTTLSVQTYGYKGNMVYFDCVQTPFIKQEFYSNEGEEHVYSFDTESSIVMLVNGRTQLFLQPGDSLHVNLTYEGKQVNVSNISGTNGAVSANNLMQSVEEVRRNMRYRSQLLGCAALNITPQSRINDSKTLLTKVQELIKKAENISPEAATYITAETEGSVYLSFMEYPVMYADIRKVPVEKQEIGDYSRLMDGFAPRTDAMSLSSPEYVSMLMRYCFYRNELKARQEGKTYVFPNEFEAMYGELAQFYDGAVRDAVLYNVICNFIRGGKEVDRADAIIKDYKAKYNKNAFYAKVLDSLMQ